MKNNVLVTLRTWVDLARLSMDETIHCPVEVLLDACDALEKKSCTPIHISDGMWECNRCGADIESYFGYCSHCGSIINWIKEEK